MEVPSELKRYAKYHYAAESISNYNPTASQVLRHVFSDYCTDEILPLTASPDVHQFLETYKQSLDPFPCDGPAEMRYFANDLYNSLLVALQSGKISLELPDQFWLCSTIYSVIDGEEAEIREQMCRYAAVSLKKLVTKPAEAPTIPNENRDRISNDLDRALAMIKLGDREATKRYLEDALLAFKKT